MLAMRYRRNLDRGVSEAYTWVRDSHLLPLANRCTQSCCVVCESGRVPHPAWPSTTGSYSRGVPQEQVALTTIVKGKVGANPLNGSGAHPGVLCAMRQIQTSFQPLMLAAALPSGLRNVRRYPCNGLLVGCSTSVVDHMWCLLALILIHVGQTVLERAARRCCRGRVSTVFLYSDIPTC